MRLRAFTLVAFGAWSGAALAAQNDQQRLRFEVEADAVRLDVAVTTVEGRQVPGITAEDLRIYENGELQTITNFTASPAPVSLVLLLDVSSSIRPSLDGIKAGAFRFLGELDDGDTARIGFFNHAVRFTETFTGLRSRCKKPSCRPGR